MDRYPSSLYDPEIILPKPVPVTEITEAQRLAMDNQNIPSQDNPFATIDDLSEFEDDLSEFENSIHLFNGQQIPEGKSPKYVYLDTGNIASQSPYTIQVPPDYNIVDIVLSDSGTNTQFHLESDGDRFQTVTTDEDPGIYRLIPTATYRLNAEFTLASIDGIVDLEGCRVIFKCQRGQFDAALPTTVVFDEAGVETSKKLVVAFTDKIGQACLDASLYTVKINGSATELLTQAKLHRDLNAVELSSVTLGVFQPEDVVTVSFTDLENVWGGAIPDVTDAPAVNPLV